MLTNKCIGVLAGGTSAEREISLRSGNAIYKTLLDLGYDAVLIDAGDDLCESLKKNAVEIVFMALHGGHGENGAVQGMLEVMGIHYTGSGILASAMAMDKEVSKKMFLYHNIPVPPFVVVRGEELGVMSKSQGSDLKAQSSNLYSLLKDMEVPWVVKPVSEGSSIGVSILKSEYELANGLKTAFSYGSRVIIEKYIRGKEIHIGVLGQRVLGGVEVRPLKEFYSYEAKYTAGLTQYILPPEVDNLVYDTLKAMALKAHNALGCKGATRVDLILDEFNKPYVLEVNTIPGMTETSLLPKIARLSGMEFPDLIEEILKLAVSGQ